MSRIFCVGMNYPLHVQELNDKRPEKPVIFMKPYSALLAPGVPLVPPAHGREFDYEAELVLRIGCEGVPQSDEEALDFVDGSALGLDLTLRDVQREVRSAALPWEISKAFDGSAPVGPCVMPQREALADGMRFECRINGEVRQQGNTGEMIFSCAALVRYIAGIWRLLPGDLIFTGTPKGIGSLCPGDCVTLSADAYPEVTWTVASPSNSK